jgi:hypothetical protein
LGGIDHLIIDRGESIGFSDFAGHPVDHPDLLTIQIAAPKRLPHRRQVSGHPAAAGQQAAHRIGLVT